LNYLAHFYLSRKSEELLIGNFIADAVKGSAYKSYPPEIAKGILMHRNIDTFTDQHPVTELSKARLRPRYRKYSGVIIDIYYDHFLAVKWEQFSEIKLQDFADYVYELMNAQKNILPERSGRFLSYMTQNNILYNYSRLEGIEKVLTGMSRRTVFQSGMENASEDLKKYYSEFEKEFDNFFPELIEFSKQYIETF
jgi:acyl carrier protein phosphodiesterase